MIVVDASVMVPLLADDADEGALIRARIRGEVLAAPQLVDLEVMSVLRRLSRSGELSRDRTDQAIDDLIGFPLQRASHRPLLPRCWELRHHLSSYDAAYVALAEALGAILLTADGRLLGARGPRCTVELVS